MLLVQGFYTVIGPLGICEASGLTRQQAAEAFGDVMDYCMGRRPDFAAGVLPGLLGGGHAATLPMCGGCSCWRCGVRGGGGTAAGRGCRVPPAAAAAAPVREPDTGLHGRPAGWVACFC